MNYRVGLIRQTKSGLEKIMITGDEEKATIALVNNNDVDSFELFIEPRFWLLNQDDVPEIIEQLYAESINLTK